MPDIAPLTLTPLQRTLAIAGAFMLFALIVWLVYRRALREDYGAVWFAIGLLILVFAVWEDGLRLLARALDAVTLTAPIFLLAVLFLTALAIAFSIRLSEVSRQIAALAREIALLRADDGAAAPPDGADAAHRPTGRTGPT